MTPHTRHLQKKKSEIEKLKYEAKKPVDIAKDPIIKQLRADMKESKNEWAKLKDSLALYSHKLIDVLDWKTMMLKEIPKLERKVKILFAEHEKAE